MRSKLPFITFILTLLSFPVHAQVNEVSAEDFFYTILPQMDKPIVLDFWATWCGPCHQYSPTFSDIADQNKRKADFYRVNVDNNEEWCQYWNIRSIPTTIVVYNKSGDYLRAEGVLKRSELRKMIKEGIEKMESDDDDYF